MSRSITKFPLCWVCQFCNFCLDTHDQSGQPVWNTHSERRIEANYFLNVEFEYASIATKSYLTKSIKAKNNNLVRHIHVIFNRKGPKKIRNLSPHWQFIKSCTLPPPSFPLFLPLSPLQEETNWAINALWRLLKTPTYFFGSQLEIHFIKEKRYIHCSYLIFISTSVYLSSVLGLLL